jgi:hypothetical protein
MCFSPQVDVVAGVGLTIVAIDTLRHTRSGRTLPIALLPAIFAFHTFVSAFVWWGAQGVVPQVVGDVAANTFMFIAFVFFPIYLPISILILERPGWRRDVLLALAGAGVIAGAIFLVGLLDGRGSAVACDYAIDFRVLGLTNAPVLLYVLATCGAMLLSGYRPIFIWGICNIVAAAFLSVAATRGFPSLWCFWAAITSVFIAWFIRRLSRAHDNGEPWPWEPIAEDQEGSGRTKIKWPR